MVVSGPTVLVNYEKVFKNELKKLTDAVPSSTELKLTIRPYR